MRERLETVRSLRPFQAKVNADDTLVFHPAQPARVFAVDLVRTHRLWIFGRVFDFVLRHSAHLSAKDSGGLATTPTHARGRRAWERAGRTSPIAVVEVGVQKTLNSFLHARFVHGKHLA